ncbi:MAG: DUF3100 domain-containing protein [Lachnospiraceae bacterium]|jgi:fluoride ion exporter CrcB/FEX
MSQTAKKETVVDMVLSTKDGRWPVFIKLFALLIGSSVIAELIGTVTIPLGGIGKINIIPMIFAMLIAVVFTPDALGRLVSSVKKFCGEKEVELSENIIMLMLLILGVKLGTSAGPNIVKIIQAGPALIFQEFGNLGTMLIGLPIAMILGMRREAVGATVSICREPTLGLISEKYGINSPEGLGVMGTYIVGNLFGTLFFGLMASMAANSPIHPYALAMACGMGSGSMMTAASTSLAESLPMMKDEILAYAATSNIMTNVTGLYMECFIAIPLANKVYKVLSKVMGRKDA